MCDDTMILCCTTVCTCTSIGRTDGVSNLPLHVLFSCTPCHAQHRNCLIPSSWDCSSLNNPSSRHCLSQANFNSFMRGCWLLSHLQLYRTWCQVYPRVGAYFLLEESCCLRKIYEKRRFRIIEGRGLSPLEQRARA